MGVSWHSSQRQSLYPYAIYCIYSTFLIPNVSLDPSGASPFFLCRCPGTRYRKRGTAEPPLQGVALPCRSGSGREVGECSPGLYTASFFLLTGMIPGLGCLQILMVVYIICRYRFSFYSSFLYFLLWLCRRLMADVGFCSRNLSVILSWLLYLDGLFFPSFSIGRSRYHSF